MTATALWIVMTKCSGYLHPVAVSVTVAPLARGVDDDKSLVDLQYRPHRGVGGCRGGGRRRQSDLRQCRGHHHQQADEGCRPEQEASYASSHSILPERMVTPSIVERHAPLINGRSTPIVGD